MILNDQFVFIVSPSSLFDVGTKVIVPSFAALFPETSLELSCDEAPFLLTVFLD